MKIEDLIERTGAEWIGGRLVAMVDGEKQYITSIADSGETSLNELGMRLQFELESAPAAPAPKAKRVKKEEAPAEVVVPADDVQIEV